MRTPNCSRHERKEACAKVAEDRRQRIKDKRGRDLQVRIKAALREPNDGPKRPIVLRLLGLK